MVQHRSQNHLTSTIGRRYLKSYFRLSWSSFRGQPIVNFIMAVLSETIFRKCHVTLFLCTNNLNRTVAQQGRRQLLCIVYYFPRGGGSVQESRVCVNLASDSSVEVSKIHSLEELLEFLMYIFL